MQPISIHRTCCHQQLLTHQTNSYTNIGNSMSTDRKSSSLTSKHKKQSSSSSSSISESSTCIKYDECLMTKQTKSTCVQQQFSHKCVHRNHSNLIAVNTNSNANYVSFIDDHTVQVYILFNLFNNRNHFIYLNCITIQLYICVN